jgi:hypothetical protein
MSEQFNQTQAKTRLLLALWDMGEPGSEVKKGDLTRRVTKAGEKASYYHPILDDLAQDGAIAIAKVKATTLISLSARGRQILAAGLKSSEFGYGGTQVGSRVANALLKWIRHMGEAKTGLDSLTREIAPKITTYDEFKTVAIEVYESLRYDPEHGKLVPIYKIRREIGDRISHEQFDEWLVEMHKNDDLYLHGGGKMDATQDQIIDSIYSDVLKTLYFIAERLTH